MKRKWEAGTFDPDARLFRATMARGRAGQEASVISHFEDDGDEARQGLGQVREKFKDNAFGGVGSAFEGEGSAHEGKGHASEGKGEGSVSQGDFVGKGQGKGDALDAKTSVALEAFNANGDFEGLDLALEMAIDDELALGRLGPKSLAEDEVVMAPTPLTEDEVAMAPDPPAEDEGAMGPESPTEDEDSMDSESPAEDEDSMGFESPTEDEDASGPEYMGELTSPLPSSPSEWTEGNRQKFCAGYGGQPCQGPRCENFDCPYQLCSTTENEEDEEREYYNRTRHERGTRRYERGDSLADRDPQEKRRQGPSSD